MSSSVLSRILLLAASVSPVLGSCAYGTHLLPRAEEGKVEVNTFGYFGETGPFNWAALNVSTNAACAQGTRQSPIDMVEGAFTLVPSADVALTIADIAEGAEFENLGTTVEVVSPAGNTMTFAGTTYELQQFHFHLPGEHIDNGVVQLMEMHMVWQSADAKIAVIGAYIDLATGAAVAAPAAAPAAEKARRHPREVKHARQEAAPAAGAATTLLETVFSSVEAISAPGTVTKTAPLVMSELVNLLKAGNFQNYDGSLTTPPCSEGVTWLVATQKLSIQATTFQKVRSVIGFNQRPAQNSLGSANLLQVAMNTIQTLPAAAPAAPVAEAPAATSVAAPAAEAPAATPPAVVEAPAVASAGRIITLTHA